MRMDNVSIESQGKKPEFIMNVMGNLSVLSSGQ